MTPSPHRILRHFPAAEVCAGRSGNPCVDLQKLQFDNGARWITVDYSGASFGELPSAGAKAPRSHEHTSARLSALESADERLNLRTIDCRLLVIPLGLYADEFWTERVLPYEPVEPASPGFPVCSVKDSRPPYPMARRSLRYRRSKNTGGSASTRSSSSPATAASATRTSSPAASLGDSSLTARPSTGGAWPSASGVAFGVLNARYSGNAERTAMSTFSGFSARTLRPRLVMAY